MTKAEKGERALALLFLQEVQDRAMNFATVLDPKHRRDYVRDPLLRALDAINVTAQGPLHQVRAGVSIIGSKFLHERWQPKKRGAP